MDQMIFPETLEEFIEQYKIVDKEKIYTNGAELIPVFRIRQWLEHLEEQSKPPEERYLEWINKTKRQAEMESPKSIEKPEAIFDMEVFSYDYFVLRYKPNNEKWVTLINPKESEVLKIFKTYNMIERC